MRAVFLASAFVITAAGAAAAKDNWQGEVMVSAVNAQCTAENVQIGDNYLSHYFPSGISNNGANSFLSFFQRRNAETLRTVGRPAAGKAFTGAGISGRGEAYSPNGSFAAFSVLPAAFNVNTKTLTIIGSINNFRNIVGCTVSFEGAYINRIDQP